MARSCLAAPLAVAALLAWPTGAAATRLPRPGQPESHAAYAQAIDAARADALRQALAAYDKARARDPADDIAAVERCRLLDATTRHDDDDDDGDDDDAATACRAELARRFPASPAALLYRLGFMAPEERIAFAQRLLAQPRARWSERQRAQLHEQLARAYAHNTPRQAAEQARLALAHDPTLDLSLILGKQLIAEGRRSEAIVALSAHPSGGGFALTRKALALADAGAPERALWMLALDPQAHGYVTPAQEGAILESAGKLEQARALYARDPARRGRHAGLAHLFELELARGDAAAADRAYQALRDLGWRADPFGGYRLALARKHPSLAWRARDAAGLGGFGLGLLVGLLLPALWLLPLHHWALWRQLRRPLRLPPPRLISRWRLAQLWLGSAALLLAQMSGVFLFHYAVATSWFWRADDERMTTSLRELAQLGVWTVLAEVALLALLLVRPRDLRLFGPGRWSVAKSVGQALLAMGLLVLATAVYIGLSGRGRAPVVHPGVFSIDEMVSAMRQVYGVGAVLLTVVVLTPIAEELVFRSLMLDVLARSLPWLAANVAQAALFAAAHGEPRRFAYLFAVGFLAGWLRVRSGGLLASMTLHALNNALATAAVLATAAHPARAPQPAATAPLPPALRRCVEGAPAVKAAANDLGRNRAVALNNIAWALAIDPKTSAECLEQAANAVDESLTMVPELGVTLDTEATLFYRQGRLDDAVELERDVIERFGGDGSAYAQLARFLRARRARTGQEAMVLGTAAPTGVQLNIVPDRDGQAFSLALGQPFAEGVTLYYQLSDAGERSLGLLRVQLGPRHPREVRMAAAGTAMRLGSVASARLVLIDSRGCEGCAAGAGSWSLQFPDRTVDAYP